MRLRAGVDPQKAAALLLSPSFLPNLDSRHAFLLPPRDPSRTLPKPMGQDGCKLLVGVPWLMAHHQ